MLIFLVWSAAFMFCLDVKPSGFCYRPKIALLFTPPAAPPPPPPPLLCPPPPVIAIKSLVFLLRPLHGFIHKVLFTSPATLPPLLSMHGSVSTRPVKRKRPTNNTNTKDELILNRFDSCDLPGLPKPVSFTVYTLFHYSCVKKKITIKMGVVKVHPLTDVMAECDGER